MLLLLEKLLGNGLNEQKRKSLVSLLASYFLATTMFSMVCLTKIKYRIDCIVCIQVFPAWHACLMELETSWPSELCRIRCLLLQVITSGSFLKLSRFLSKVFVCRVSPESCSFDYWDVIIPSLNFLLVSFSCFSLQLCLVFWITLSVWKFTLMYFRCQSFVPFNKYELTWVWSLKFVAHSPLPLPFQ